MLTIRPEQMHALGDDERRRFVERLAAYLRRETPRLSSDLTDTELAAFCEAATLFALRHGLSQEAHVVRLGLCLLKMKVDFIAVQPPVWVTQPRERGEMPEDGAWVQYVFDGAKAKPSGSGKS